MLLLGSSFGQTASMADEVKELSCMIEDDGMINKQNALNYIRTKAFFQSTRNSFKSKDFEFEFKFKY